MPAPRRPSPAQELHQAFDAWCAHQRRVGRFRRGSTETVYHAMWQALSVWCTGQSPALRLPGLDRPTLAAYLASRSGNSGPLAPLTPRYQARLASLVQRVRAHHALQLAQQAGAAPAPGAGLAPLRAGSGRTKGASASDDDGLALAVLPASAAQQLQQWLLRSEHGPRWQALRDACAVALQLGAGLGPGDLRALRLIDVQPASSRPQALPGPLRVPASGNAPAHEAPLADWAAALLARWLLRRQAEQLGGAWLLPATRSGKPWGKVAQYLAAQRVIDAAGLPAAPGGSFRLRHSFALRQLQHGHDPDLLARWLGVVDPAVITRYQQALPGWAGLAAAPGQDGHGAAAARRGPARPV